MSHVYICACTYMSTCMRYLYVTVELCGKEVIQLLSFHCHFNLSIYLPFPLFCRRRPCFQALKFDSSTQVGEETLPLQRVLIQVFLPLTPKLMIILSLCFPLLCRKRSKYGRDEKPCIHYPASCETLTGIHSRAFHFMTELHSELESFWKSTRKCQETT